MLCLLLAAIASLPKSKYKRRPSQDEEKSAPEECCICLEAFKDGENIRRLQCFHIFHVKEIDKWLRTNNTCPVCKTAVDA
jgi:hypothetical protein